MLLVLRLRLSDGLLAVDCLRAVSTELLLYDSSALSDLQIWLQLDPSYHYLVEARRRIDTCLFPLVRLQARRPLNSRRALSPFDQLQVARLVNHAP